MREENEIQKNENESEDGVVGPGPDLGWWGPWGKVFGGGPLYKLSNLRARAVIIIITKYTCAIKE